MNSKIPLNSEITLHEYHLLYPNTAEVPTLVQSGLIDVLLERQRRKSRRKAHRRARLQRTFKYLFTSSCDDGPHPGGSKQITKINGKEHMP